MIKVWTDLNTALFSSSFRLTEPKISWGGIFKRTDDHIFEKTLKIELSPIPQAYYLKCKPLY
jgi:hypothetical protein